MTKNYGNLIINIFWRIITICLVVTLSYFTFDSIANEHYRVVPGSIDYRVTTKGKHFKNFTVKNSDGKTYRLEGKVDKNGRIIYFVNGEKMQIQSKMSNYIKSDERTYCNRRDCKGHSDNKYNRIDDNEILCYHDNQFYLFIRILILVLCIPLVVGLIFGIIRNNDLYKRYNDYDYVVNRKYDHGDYLTPFGLYIDSIVCHYDLKKYIKEFFGYTNE
jgi:hypothetical protein